MIVEAAVQEDVDVVSLSILSGAHMGLFARILELLRERGAEDVLVIGGGIIPEEDAAELRRMGVAQIYGPGTPTTEPVRFLQEWFEKQRAGRGAAGSPAEG
jgi:methylmalonyl-CoA mutase C-terminal domain/subunit